MENKGCNLINLFSLSVPVVSTEINSETVLDDCPAYSTPVMFNCLLGSGRIFNCNETLQFFDFVTSRKINLLLLPYQYYFCILSSKI